MDEVFSLPRIPTTTWINDCDFRVNQGGESMAICKVVSMEVGHTVACDPRMCARCLLNGRINPTYLRGLVQDVLRAYLQIAAEGFYAEADTIELCLRCYKHFTRPEARVFLMRQITRLINLGRISVDGANRMLEKMPLLQAGAIRAEVAEPDFIAGQAEQVDIPPCCDGESEEEAKSVLEGLKHAVSVGAKVVKSQVKRVSDVVYGERRAVCMKCMEKDPVGVRLLRPGSSSGWYSCGEPMSPKELLAGDRDIKANGCGCWLNLKWRGKDEECPRGKW